MHEIYMCTHLCENREEYEMFQIELAKNYGIADWKEDLRKVMMRAGLENRPTVFLFSDTQVLVYTHLTTLIIRYYLATGS